MKRYIKQDTFDFSATTVARVHLQSGESIESLAEKVSIGHVDEYSDYRLREEIEAAAEKIIEYFEQDFERYQIPSALRHMQHSILNFEMDGSPRKKRRFFNGTKFNSEKEEIKGKSSNAAIRILAYDRMIANQTIPPAPKGWEP